MKNLMYRAYAELFQLPDTVRDLLRNKSGATMIDLTAVICPYVLCPAVHEGMITYRDAHHLTATFAESLADELAPLLPEP